MQRRTLGIYSISRQKLRPQWEKHNNSVATYSKDDHKAGLAVHLPLLLSFKVRSQEVKRTGQIKLMPPDLTSGLQELQ